MKLWSHFDYHFCSSPLAKKPPDVTKSRKVKTEQLLRVDDHDFTMRPAFGGESKTQIFPILCKAIMYIITYPQLNTPIIYYSAFWKYLLPYLVQLQTPDTVRTLIIYPNDLSANICPLLTYSKYFPIANTLLTPIIYSYYLSLSFTTFLIPVIYSNYPPKLLIPVAGTIVRSIPHSCIPAYSLYPPRDNFMAYGLLCHSVSKTNNMWYHGLSSTMVA